MVKHDISGKSVSSKSTHIGKTTQRWRLKEFIVSKIGGSSNPDKVVAALEIITSDPNVKVILFNIFGGITRCDDVANGIVEATKRIDINVPLVIRLTGTNEEEGVAILEGSGMSAATSMDEVVERAVALAKSA